MKILIGYTDNIIEGKTVIVKSEPLVPVSWGDLQESSSIGFGPISIDENKVYLNYSGKPFQGYPSIVAEYDDDTNELEILCVSMSNVGNLDERIKRVNCP